MVPTGGDGAGAVASRREGLAERLKFEGTLAPFTMGGVPAIAAFARNEATRHGTLCLVALKRWRLAQQGPPVDLQEIVTRAGLPAVPLDPYSKGPLKLVTVDGAARRRRGHLLHRPRRKR